MSMPALCSHATKRLLNGPPKGYIRLYRGAPDPVQQAQKPSNLPEWARSSPEYKASEAAAGRWFTHDPKEVDWYVKSSKTNSGSAQVTFVDIPLSVARRYRLSNPFEPSIKEARTHCRRREKLEFFLPRHLADKASPIPETLYQRLLHHRNTLSQHDPIRLKKSLASFDVWMRLAYQQAEADYRRMFTRRPLA